MTEPKASSGEAMVCLVLVAVWTLVAAWQALAVSPWDHGGIYARAEEVVSAAAQAMIVAVLAVWLLGVSRLLRSS